MSYSPTSPRPILRMSASPSRRVHFAEEVEYSPSTLPLPPLSPTTPRRSTDTMLSMTPPSPGPMTPPQLALNFNTLPLPDDDLAKDIGAVPVPFEDDSEVETLHPILEASRTPLIRWNLLDNISTALACLTAEQRASSAVHPPTRKLKIIGTTLPWYMSVRPSASTSSKPHHDDDYVTVEDVLRELAAGLSVNVVSSELDEGEKKRTAPAFEARCRRWRLDSRRALRARVDFLEGRTVFLGFVTESPGVLRLKVMSS
ncbi:hypothetical protein DL96DRAFT_1614061 [Flagelloscypha sp. PMI_526]|nr:hypothetical protein DL96DRAFT_1614061 [Flagelloscypha sp. PMI_526]